MKLSTVLPQLILAVGLTWPLSTPARAEVWFSPNLASVDMLDLFTAPGQWSAARSRIDVFKFDAGQVGTDGWSCDVIPTEICGSNHIANFVAVDAFNKLDQWGIDIAVESFFAGPVMSVEPLTCSDATSVFNLTAGGSINVIQSVESSGGTVRCLAMDEPIRQWMPAYYYTVTGEADPRPCLVSDINVLADHMAAYLSQMQIWFPEIPIGHIDLYPEISVDRFKEWVLALEARGVAIDFLHIDVNGPRVVQYNSLGFDIDMAADFAELKSFLNARGISFGVILTDLHWNEKLWEPGSYVDQTYYENTMEWVETVESMNVDLDQSIFQSWVHPYFTTGSGGKETPINLPENNSSIYSHTRLINEALIVLSGGSTSAGPHANSYARLYQNRPNPFHTQTMVVFELHRASHVQLTIFDSRGRRIRTMVDGFKPAGNHRVPINTQNLAAGAYFYRLESGGKVIETRKMMVLK